MYKKVKCKVRLKVIWKTEVFISKKHFLSNTKYLENIMLLS